MYTKPQIVHQWLNNKIIRFENPKGGYQKLYLITQGIPNHRIGHFVRPNKVALKYLNFKKDIDLDVHVKMFNSIVKTNVETFEKYIINAFSYILRNIALD
jgi:hypothetical protein